MNLPQEYLVAGGFLEMTLRMFSIPLHSQLERCGKIPLGLETECAYFRYIRTTAFRCTRRFRSRHQTNLDAEFLSDRPGQIRNPDLFFSPDMVDIEMFTPIQDA